MSRRLTLNKHFRRCAGAVVFNASGLVLLGNRNDVSGDNWQLPQGGIEEGETPVVAAKRELFEETGVSSVIPIYTDETPSRYEFTEEIKQNIRNRGIFNDGQDIYFSLFFFTGNDKEINLAMPHPEFKAYCWESLDFAVAHIVNFKKDVYKSMAERLSPLIKQYLSRVS